MQNDLTKYLLGVPRPDHQANTVAEAFVVHFVCLHRIPETILTDQGTKFLSKTFSKVYKLLKINKVNTSPFHPQTNGSLERSHRTLAECLLHFVNKNLSEWDHLLPYAFFVHNSTEQSSTNFQPYALVYGRILAIPVKLKFESEPRYNYHSYLYDLKQNLRK
jgi:transposase InsO family protein